jgi:hypothetical protein
LEKVKNVILCSSYPVLTQGFRMMLEQRGEFRVFTCKRYLADLPILDRRVLDRHYAENKSATSIAVEMGLSRLHVERILARARAFAAPWSCTSAVDPSWMPAQSRLPLAARNGE